MQFVRIHDSNNSPHLSIISQPHWANSSSSAFPIQIQNPTISQTNVFQISPQEQSNFQNHQAREKDDSNHHPTKPKRMDKEEKKLRKRIATKRWRDKKDGSLHSLEALNDQLREQALELRKQSLSLIAENRILEKELHFFQNFMTKIMNVAPR